MRIRIEEKKYMASRPGDEDVFQTTGQPAYS